MPLTLYVLVAAVILYLYIRRANLGIDLHPGEKASAPFRAPQPRVDVRGTVPFLSPDTRGIPPYLPPIPGTPNGPASILQ